MLFVRSALCDRLDDRVREGSGVAVTVGELDRTAVRLLDADPVPDTEAVADHDLFTVAEALALIE